MAFLIAKILFLLALAAAFGAWLAWWAMRRHYQDVTVEHGEYRQEWSQWRQAVDTHLARPAPTPDYAPVVVPLTHQMEQLHATVRGIEIPQPAPATDLQPVMSRLQTLEAKLSALHIPPAADLSPLMACVQALDDKVGAIRMPTPKETDLGPVLMGLATVAAGVKAIDIPKPAPAVDLAPLHERSRQLEAAVKGIVIPSPKEVDLQPVLNRMQALETQLGALRIPPAADLTPVLGAVRALDDKVAAIRMPTQKETDLGPVLAGLATVAAGVKAIDIPKPAPAVDLAPLHERSRQLEAAVKGIVIPQPKEADLTPLMARIDQLERAVMGIEIPLPKGVDLQPLLDRMQALETQLGALHIPPAADLTPVLGAVRALDDKVGAIRMPTPKETDLGPVLAGLATVAAGVKAIEMPKPTPAVDLAPLHERSRQLEAAVKGIVIPSPKEVDLQPVLNRMQALETQLGALRIPPAADLTPVLGAVRALDDKVAAIRMPTQKETDLGPVLMGLATVAAGVKAIEMPKPAPAVDLMPLQERTRELESAVRGLVIPQPKEIDLLPVHARLQAIEEALAHRPAPVAAPVVPAPMAQARQGSRNLLYSATFGKPDDLKRIKGVAEVLEKMMHDIGVYYFWQIAEWTPADIVYVDSLLTAFKGRINRDDWVTQSKAFAAQPEAARKP